MLIDEIIELLSSERGSLTDALLKTKVFLHQIGKKELVEWVNNELSGYPDGSDIPVYRIVPTTVKANVANPGWQVSSTLIPLAHLEADYRENFEQSKILESISSLEGFVSKNKGQLIRYIPMEANGMLGRGLGNGFQVQQAWCEIGRNSIVNVLAQIRSRLLDFLLNLFFKVIH